MFGLIKQQVSELSESQSASFKLFRQPVDELNFSEMVSVSSFLQALSKIIDKRRTKIGNLLDERINSGDVDERPLVESETGKSVSVEMPGFSVQQVRKGGDKKPSVGNLKRLMKGKGLEDQVNNLLKPKKKSLNKKKLASVLKEAEEAGIDTSEVYEVKEYEVDTAKLSAFAAVTQEQDLGFVITEEDVDSVYEEVKVSSYVKCTLDKDIQKSVIEAVNGETSSFILPENLG